MPWIKPVKMSEMKKIQKEDASQPTVFHRLMGHTPELLEAFTPLQNAVKQVSISDLMREQIITYVSRLNGCEYCTASHAEMLRSLGETEDQIENLLEDRMSSFDDETKAVLTYAKHLAKERQALSRDDIELLRSFGMSDRKIAEVNHLIAYTSYTNQLSIGLGL
ncbi:hypothetical protein CR205_10060 [Alteribacter lacisalsi]|uniref:Carboxymuconolactone decarboxylase-like domain-containing protein n=1 Tax=Alteribacter lacisalsi TaxID=2045244 RepID=A0A2W0HDE3_9BACI|nr:peroxidase-related enzyme [Alteribacter lacisalsi]PYZ98891.1 hypothetical protein CR205_10060 [Alteribacter lacisalsi]